MGIFKSKDKEGTPEKEKPGMTHFPQLQQFTLL